MPEYRYPQTSVIAMSRGERARLQLYSKRQLESKSGEASGVARVDDYVLSADHINDGVKSVVMSFSSNVNEVVVTVSEDLLQKFMTALDLCVGRGELTKEQRESVTVLAAKKEIVKAPEGVVNEAGPKGEEGVDGSDELPDKWDSEPEKVEKKKVVKKKTTKKKPAKKKAAKKVEEKKVEEKKSEESDVLDSLEQDINDAFGISDDDDE